MNTLIEGKDFYFNENGLMVMTEHYHLKKWSCCGLGCLHCPYLYKMVPEPKRTHLLNSKIEK